MRSRLLALAALALLLAPTAHAAQPKPEYPAPLVALLPRWIAEAEALGNGSTDAPWYARAHGYLDGARSEAALGHVRGTMYDLETFTELVLGGRINDTARGLRSDAERKSYTIDRANEWRLQGNELLQSFRTRLKTLEPDIHSVQAMEMALYAADGATSSALSLGAHEATARDFQRNGGFSDVYVAALVRIDHTALLNLQWSMDILDLVGQYEGLPPKLIAENWTAVQEIALSSDPYGEHPPNAIASMQTFATDVRSHGEATLAVAVSLAETRGQRAGGISLIFGDAVSRGKDVVTDAGRGMNKQLNNTTMDTPRSYGMLGVFTADAIDRVEFTQPFLASQKADLPTIVSAWAALEHQTYVTQTLAAASPVQPPPPPPPHRTPGPALLALVLVACALALATARRARAR